MKNCECELRYATRFAGRLFTESNNKVKAPNTAVVKIASYYGGISIFDIYSCFIQFKLTKTESIYSKSITS